MDVQVDISNSFACNPQENSNIVEVFQNPTIKANTFTLSEVSDHCHLESVWIAINDNVYDITQFLNEHPGGMEILLEHAGTDATLAFEEKGHSKYAESLLSKYLIGRLAESDRRVL